MREVAGKLGKSETLVHRWASRWRWAERVRAYEDHTALVQRDANDALIRLKAPEWLARQQAIREAGWQVQEKAIRACEEALRRFMANEGRGATLGDVARLMEAATKVGRLAAGMATERTETSHEARGVLSVEIMAALDKVYGAEGERQKVAVIDVETVERESKDTVIRKGKL